MMTQADKPFVEGKTIGAVLRDTARAMPDQLAAVFTQQEIRLTWSQFDGQVDAAARGLMALGLERGDHLAVWCTNWPRWVILQFATARTGVVMVTVNPANRASELEYVLHQSDAKALALIDHFKTSDYFAILREIPREKLPMLRSVISLANRKDAGMIGWDEFIDRGRGVTDEQLTARAATLTPLDPINIQYTSGTTGFPKGAMLSHRNLLFNAFYIGQRQRITRDDRICIPVPFYHCFGCVLGTMCAAVYGAAMVVPHEYFDAGKTLDAVEKERCTAIYGVPTMFIAELESPHFAKRHLKSLRTGIMAGSPCPIELMKKVTGVMGAHEITIAYGQTEASPVITQTRADDPIELRVGTVGQPLPGVEVKIVDSHTGETLPTGESGELCARGHVVMLGYYNMPEATARAIDADGWLHTGDLAMMEPNGYYRITGRLKDMVIRGGEKIFPREVEEFLYRHPKVEEVQVVGVPDVKFGEQLLACIKLRQGHTASEEEIRDFCKASLAHFKVPHHIKFVTEYPMTVTGKIQKFKIREQAIQELGLEGAAKVKTA